MEEEQKKAQADRGKYAEKVVKRYLELCDSEYAGFDWERIYDARSAGGRFPSRPGDFAFYSKEHHGLIEVKQVDHEFRLPRKNFKNEQLAKLYKRQLAGGDIIILIYHTPIKLWRCIPLSWLRERLDVPSWDLREFEPMDDVGWWLNSITDEGAYADC